MKVKGTKSKCVLEEYVKDNLYARQNQWSMKCRARGHGGYWKNIQGKFLKVSHFAEKCTLILDSTKTLTKFIEHEMVRLALGHGAFHA